MGETDHRFLFWQKWLTVVAALVALAGAGLALVGGIGLFDPVNALFEVTFWKEGSLPPEAREYRSWLYGVLGGTMAGWGVILYYVASYPFARKEKWAFDAIALSTAIWYLIDTGASLMAGVWINGALNTLVAAVVALPLLATRRYFN